jgi:hypothetical protein
MEHNAGTIAVISILILGSAVLSPLYMQLIQAQPQLQVTTTSNNNNYYKRTKQLRQVMLNLLVINLIWEKMLKMK